MISKKDGTHYSDVLIRHLNPSIRSGHQELRMDELLDRKNNAILHFQPYRGSKRFMRLCTRS